jgi:dolichyl-phosphate beta-glucosyltransferase
MSEIHLSVIIPAYNEERRIEKTVREIEKYLKNQKYSWEILVVNDGSKDKTSQVVENLRSEIANLRLIDNKINRGKGAVVRQGMLEAKGKYRLFTDADNSTSINHIEKMWPEFEKGVDVVIGTRDGRDAKGACQAFPQPWWRRLLGDVFNILVKIILGLWEFWDTQCGFKCFTEKSAKEIFPKCKIERFAFDPEILVIAKKKGFKISKIPVYWINEPESKVKFKSMVKMGIDLIKIRLNLIKGVYAQ